MYATVTSYRYATEGIERRRLRGAFVRYLAPTLVDKLAEDGSTLSLGGEERVIGVMFADLTGFTVASTEMTAEALTSEVNRYFHYIVAPIDQTGGYVSDAGNSALAIRERRCGRRARRECGARGNGDNRKRQHTFEEDAARGVHGFTIKVEIDRGRTVIGDLGSENHYSYTAMARTEPGGAAREHTNCISSGGSSSASVTPHKVSNNLLMRHLKATVC